ncbi:hypothetical protein [Nocardiopsis changdeensis]|uniref:hypothetical protein n=1 Tax=Nocardiopsis changdeensis TaxID=2831969 RepID=UPI003F46446B
MPSSTPWDSGGAHACLPNGAIDPALIPIPDVDSDALEATATKLTGTGGDIGQTGNDITGSWAGLSGFYSAPEVDTLFAKMDPVGSDTADVRDAVDTAAGALSTFAEEAREIKARLVSLKGRAEDLRAEIGTDEDWAEDDDLRERNNTLNNLVADAVFEYQYAERNCANKITGLFGGTYFAGRSELSPEVPGLTSDGRERAYYGTFKPLVDAANPWGSPVGAPPAGGILGDGLAALGDLGVGAALGIGAATGLYRDGRAAYPFGTEWQQNMGAYFDELKEGYSTLTGFYVDGQWTSHDSVDEWYFHFSGAAGELVGSFFAYDQWEERPAYSITTGIANTALLAGGIGVFKFLLDNPTGIGGGPDLGSSTPDLGNGFFPDGHHGSSTERPGGSPLPDQEGFGGGNDGTPTLAEVQQTLSDLNGLNGTNQSSAPGTSGTGTADPGIPEGRGSSTTDTNAPAAPSNTADTTTVRTSPSTDTSGGTSDDPWSASPAHASDRNRSPSAADGDLSAVFAREEPGASEGREGGRVSDPSSENPEVFPGSGVSGSSSEEFIANGSGAYLDAHDGIEGDERWDGGADDVGGSEPIQSNDDRIESGGGEGSGDPEVPFSVSENVPEHFAREIVEAVRVIESVHRLPPGLDQVTIRIEALPKGEFGKFNSRDGVISLNPEQLDLRATLVHEMAHAMDSVIQRSRTQTRFGMASAMPGTPEMRGWAQAVRGSDEYRAIRGFPDSSYRRYLLAGPELFARSYAQWIAEKTGDPMLEVGMRRFSGDSGIEGFRQWSEDGFRPISEALDAVFEDDWSLM